MERRTLTPRTLAPLFVPLLLAAWIAAQVTAVNRSQPGSPTVNVLYKFPYDGTPPNGYSHGKVVYSELIQGADGNFYGTTVNGGSGLCADGFGVEGCGTIFKITSDGVETVLFNFTYDPNTNTAVNGMYPYGGLVQGRDGNFYGTASLGGNPNAGGNCLLGCGTIFRITPSGKFTLLHQFAGVGGNPAEGASPTGRLILGSDGQFYGTTYSGGSVRYGVGNEGTIFSVSSSGAFTTLHTFDTVDGLDGANPYAGLIQGKDGNFYGTTYFGGTDGVGTVFRFSKSVGVTVLHSFVQPQHLNYPDGAFLQAALIQASDGQFYGAATQGGVSAGGWGTLFKISPNGTFTKIFDLDPTGTFPGWYPLGGMIQASDGNLYGTTENGGPPDCNCGTAYQLTLAGKLSLLVGFEDVTDGRLPVSVPLQGADGILYITNSRGPSIGPHDGGGTAIQISNGLPKPKPGISKFLPTSGPIGQHVTISGVHFVGTTKVNFNGTGATFTVKSTNTITATVPAGATSGPITVTNAGGSFRSTANFTVLP